MNHPTKFQIMRANRDRKPNLLARIEAVEEEVNREWAEHRARAEAERRACFADTADWIRRTREEAIAMKRASEPEAPRRRSRWWWPFGRRAAAC